MAINVRAGVMPGRIEDYNGLRDGATVADLLTQLTAKIREREPNFEVSQYEIRQDNTPVENGAALRDGALILLTKKVKGNLFSRVIKYLFGR